MKRLGIAVITLTMFLLASCSENLPAHEPAVSPSGLVPSPVTASNTPSTATSSTYTEISSAAPEVSAKPSFSPTTKSQILFVALLQGGTTTFVATDLEDAYERGEAICTLYQEGWTHEEVDIVLAATYGKQYTEDQMTSIWGSALVGICPEYAEDLVD